jgi:hypothetical protein
MRIRLAQNLVGRRAIAPLLLGVFSAPQTAPAYARLLSTPAMSASSADERLDAAYPGTAVARMEASRARVIELAAKGGFSGEWEQVRRNLLYAAGLRDISDAVPGYGYTGHAFNDWNHCDATTMRLDVADANNGGKYAPGPSLSPPGRVHLHAARSMRFIP